MAAFSHKKKERSVSQLVFLENVVFLNFQHVQIIFPMLRRFFVFSRHMIFITSPVSLSSLFFTSSLSLLLSSSLPFSSPLLSVSSVVSVVLVSSLSCVVVVFFSRFCAVTAAAALLLLVAVAARAAAVGGSCVFLSGCFSFRSWTAENHARCVHCGQTGRWRAKRRSSFCVAVRQTNPVR